jgi:sigma-E factor negative regulatory protein RseA
MTKELSALLDGELEMHEEATLWAAMKATPHMRRTWQSYKLIGDAIRNEGSLARDITDKVMDELADEPVVVAPRSKSARRWSNAIMAMAASVAGIAAVGWLALGHQLQQGQSVPLAQHGKSQTVAAAPASGQAQGMQEYVLAHQANAPGFHLQGGTQHIRTVSAAGVAK